MKSGLLWTLAFVITITSAVYQRMTGPTYPLRGKIEFNNTEIEYKLARSHGGETNHRINLQVENENISGYVSYKRFKTMDEWTTMPLIRNGKFLSTDLPYQPPAGKLMYKVVLNAEDEQLSLAGEEPVVIRFKGEVPAVILLPHIILMFGAMLVSNRAGITIIDKLSNPRKYALWAAGLLFVGGLILGPLVQKYAFGAFWTGFPFGHDLTDNKTLIAMIGWVAALIAGRHGKPARWWVFGAAVLTMAVYLIPHSMMGSELDYSSVASPPK